MNKKGLILVIAIIILILVSLAVIMNTIMTEKGIEFIKRKGKTMSKTLRSGELEIIPTMNDEFDSKNAAWTGTFQLIWNDLKKEIVGGDIVFNPQEKIVENLNLEDFNEDMLSEDYYYKTFGFKTLEIKEEIEKEILKKFKQTSDILDDFDWSPEALHDPENALVNRYFLYSMLYREFQFENEFDELENSIFGENLEDIKYFGLGARSNDISRDQIEVLYYNSDNDFAIILKTKTDDEVIFNKNPEGKTFAEIYKNLNDKKDKYKGSKRLADIDRFKAPYLDFNEKREYTELEGKEFETLRGEATIEKALQTISFILDEKGGRIKSEAGMDVIETTSALDPLPEPIPRYFYVDDTFAIFLREKGKDLPYFASRIEEVNKFQ